MTFVMHDFFMTFMLFMVKVLREERRIRNEKAKGSSTKSYDINLDEEEVQVEVVKYSSTIPVGAEITFRVLESDVPIAEVILQSFLGFGWQETAFDRLAI